MTIDKIRSYVDQNIFNYWQALKNGNLPKEAKIFHLRSTKNILEKEIEAGILTDIKYKAELNLINKLLSEI